MITATGIGTATITAAVGSVKTEVPITVVDLKENPTEGITFETESFTLSESGQGGLNTATVTALITPPDTTDAISWSITPSTVATLSDESYDRTTGIASAKVSAVTSGSAEITLTSGNQSASLPVIVSSEHTVTSGVDVTALSPDSFLVKALDVQGNAALGIENTEVSKVSVFAWSRADQSDMQAVVAEREPGTDDFTAEFTVNTNGAHHWFEDASRIHINVYAALEGESGNGNMIYATNYDSVNKESAGDNTVAYIGYGQNIGFIRPTIFDGATAGTPDSGHLEGIRVQSNIEGVYTYTNVHVQDFGWLGYFNDGMYAGTQGYNRQLEAMQMFIYGENAANYEIQYRAFVRGIGWQDWVGEGEVAGTTGRNLPIQAVEVRINPV